MPPGGDALSSDCPALLEEGRRIRKLSKAALNAAICSSPPRLQFLVPRFTCYDSLTWRLSTTYLMKAFLSHSSKDKQIVREVASLIGESRCEYDEYTLEYTLTQQAIRRALSRSGLFVLFLSDSSTKSSFVEDEVRTAFEFRGKGILEKFLIIALDGVSYKALPEWLQDYNIATKLQKPGPIARKIDAALFSLELSKGEIHDVYSQGRGR
jgi:hypothetical protein